LSGISQSSHDLVIEIYARRRDHESPAFIDKLCAGDRFDSKCRSVDGYLDDARTQSEAIPQWLWNDQPACLVDGCPHTMTVPSEAVRAPGRRWKAMSRAVR